MYEDEEFENTGRARRSVDARKREAVPRVGDTGSQRSTSARLAGSTARLPTVKSRATLRRDDADVTRSQAPSKPEARREDPRRLEVRRESPSPRQAARSGSPQRRPANSQPSRPVRRGVPVLVTILVAILCAAAGAGISYFVLRGEVSKAKADAASAQSQASALSQQIAQMQTSSSDSESSDSENSSQSSDSEDSTQSSESESENETETSSSTKKASAGVESPWLGSGVNFTTGDSVLDQEVKVFCDSKCDTSMSLATASYNVYTGIAWSEYVERDDAQHPSGSDWRTEFARMYYENDCSGNCYEFAAFLSFCLQYLGYTDAHAEGVLVELQSGGWGDHGVVYVTSAEGMDCYCDTSRGTDGWMLPVGTYNLKLQDFESA